MGYDLSRLAKALLMLMRRPVVESMKSMLAKFRAKRGRAVALLHPRLFQQLEQRVMLSVEPPLPFLLPRHNLQAVNGFLSEPASGDPLEIALAFLDSHQQELGLKKGDLDSPFVTDQYTDGDTGLTHIYLAQQLDGLPIVNSNLNINITADGRVLNVGGGFVSGVVDLSTARGFGHAPLIPPGQAIKAVSTLGLTASVHPADVDLLAIAGQPVLMNDAAISLDPIPVRLQYLATPDGISLAWNYVLRTPDGGHWYDVHIDGETGEFLAANDWVEHATYNVYPLPVESPSDGSRSLVTDPHDVVASPYGWHDTDGVAGAEFTDTRGNNVSAQEDTNADDTGGTRPSGGSSLNFDFAINLSNAPSTYQSAAITNLFYWNNLLHDIHYRFGFNEQAGNFQTNNYGNGGSGGDAVQADAQDGSGTNNANFATPRDGQAPRMQMYLFTSPNPDRDGDLDNGIIIHEYGHGVSNRLTGGPNNAGALDAQQSGGMGEGWSDWWALMLLQRATDTQNQAMPMGTYVMNQAPTGAGIRRYPYSYDMSVNPLTLGAYNASNEVHDAGEIWCSVLWDMNWLLINKLGYSSNVAGGYSPGGAGNLLALRLVMDALKIQPANPTFLDARDAILQADLVLTGGQSRAEIWQAFARRGFGFSASAGTDANSLTVVEAFDLPNADPVVTASTPTGQVVSGVTNIDVKFSEPMDTSSFSIGSDIVSFTGPGAVNLLPQVTSFNWVDAQTLRLNVNSLTTVGAYSFVLGPNILSADNAHAMNQDRDGTSGESVQDTYTGAFTINNGFGYVAEATTYENLDLLPSGSGVTKILDNTDDSAVAISLGANTFNFYGTSYTGSNQLYVSSNGFITFGGSAVTNSALNTDLTTQPTYPTIAPLWDDYVTNQSPSGSTNDSVLYLFDTPNNRLIIEWSSVRFYGYSSSETVTFQAILQLNTGTAPGIITFNYVDLAANTIVFDNGAEATVGIKNSGTQGVDRLLIGYNTGTLGSGQAIRIDVNAINEAPTLTSVSDLTGASEDTAYNITYAALLAAANESDVDGDTVSFRIEAISSGTLTKNGVAVMTGSTTIGPSEQLVWTPAPNASGTLDAFTVRAFDKILTSASPVQVRVSTASVNDRPTFVASNPSTVNEDAGAQSISNWATFSAGAANESAQTATYTVSGVSSSSLFSAAPAVDSSGKLTYTPAADANGSTTFTVSVKDSGGTANGGIDTSLTQTFTLSVNAVNDRPTFSATSPNAVNENAGPQSVTSWASFSPGPANESGQSVMSYTVSNVSNPSLFSSQPTVSTNGTLTYTSATNASGSSTFDVVVRDSGGTALGGLDTSTVQTFTINVNSLPANITIGDATISEGNSGTTTAIFTVSLSRASAQTVTVYANTADGTAAAGSDYTAIVDQLVTFNPGDISKTVSVTLSGDTTFEANETFFINLSKATNAPITDAQAQGTINNDDAAPTISVNDVSITEGNSGTQTLVFLLTLSAASGLAASVNANTAAGTAAAGTDFVGVSNQLVTFSPGETSKSVSVTINGDTTFEADEAFTLNLTSPGGASILDGQGTGTINNDDTAPTISVDDVSIAEGNSGTKALTFTVSLSAASGLPASVTVNTADDTALAGSDYTAISNQLVSFSAGQTSKTVSVTISGDTTYESDEGFFLNLSGASGATIADQQGIGTITNDDAVSAISIDDVSIVEGNSGTKTASFTVSLSAPSSLTTTVLVNTADNTATTADSDYVAISNQLVTFNPGQTSKTISVTINGDATAEQHESFFVNLTSPTNATIGDGQGIGTIQDDDSLAVSIDDVTITEGNSGTKSAVFTLTLNAVSALTTTVRVDTANSTATAGSDFTAITNQTVTFNPGDTSKTVSVTISGDTLFELNETFFVNLTNATNMVIGDAQGVGTISNDDTAPTFSIDDVTLSEGDSGTKNATFTITLSKASGASTSVTVDTADGSATAGSDYTAIVGQNITFAAGETSKTISVVIAGDTSPETNETFFVNLTNASNATISDAQGLGTITNDDTTPPLSIDDVTISEGDSGTKLATFTLTLAAPTGVTATVLVSTADGTASAGSDYVGFSNQLVTFDPGDTSKTITVAINGDSVFESGETFTLNLSSPVNATISDGQGVGTITNDDAMPTISVNDASISEGNAGSSQATFTLTLSAVSSFATSVTVSTADGTAFSPSDFAAISSQLVTFNPGETQKTVNVVVNGDTLFELTETFTLNLSGATNATIADAQGLGTITNDDTAPTVSIGDATVSEGNSGTKTATFTLTLSAASALSASVSAATADSSATAGSDYFALSGQVVTFNPGETSKTVSVTISGDTTFESDETFFVNLSGATNVTISDGQGQGTITNDDPPPPVAHTPTISAATTNEDTLSASGLVVTRNAIDGAEVTHFKITGIIGGRLFLNDGTTQLGNGDFVTFAEGAKGLRFAPTSNLNSLGTSFGFSVQASLSASDGGLGGAVVPSSITVNSVNDAPSFNAAAPPAVNEDKGAISIANWATFSAGGGSDESTQTVSTYNISAVSNPSLFAVAPAVSASGTLSYTPAINANGSSTFVASVTDSGGVANGGVNTSTTRTFTLVVNAVNDAPTFTAPSTDVSSEDAGLVTVNGWATFNPGGGADEIGQTVVAYNVASISNPALFTALPTVGADGALIYQSAANLSGTSTFTVSVTDSGGTTPGVNTSAIQTFTIVVNSVNDAPSFVAASPIAVKEDVGAVVVANWAAFSPGGGADESTQTASYNIKNISNLQLFEEEPTVDESGTLRYKPAPQANGTSTFSISVTDSGAAGGGGVNTSITQIFTITVENVNDQPSLQATNPSAVNEDSGTVVIADWATFSPGGGIDESGQTVQSYNVAAISNASLFLTAPTVGANGSLSFTPAANVNGMSTFTVSVTDSGGTGNGGVNTSVVKTFTIVVNPVNDAPAFTAPAIQPVAEDASPIVLTNWAAFSPGGGADEAGQTAISYQVSGVSNPTLFSALPTVGANGTLSFTPAPDASGSATFVVRVTDSGGTNLGGINQSEAQTFSVEVTPVNDEPIFTASNPPALDEDSAAVSIANWASFSPGGGANESAQTVSAYHVSDVSNPALFATAPTIDQNGMLSYEILPDVSGTSMFVVSVSDSGGAPGIDTSANQTFTIDVHPVNDAPSFHRGANIVTYQNAPPISIAGWATLFSTGPADESSQSLSAVLSGFNAALFATAPTLNVATGSLSFTPASGALGATVVTITLRDDGGTDRGGADTFIDTFTIAVGNRFGNVDGINKKISVTESDNTKALFTLTGPGTGLLVPDVNGGFDIELSQTTSKSTLTITTDTGGDRRFNLQGLAVANANGPASLGKIVAKTTNLRGDLAVSGTIASIALADASGGHWSIGAPPTSKESTTITLGAVRDLSIASATPIKSFIATDWADTDSSADELSAPWIGTLSFTGSKTDTTLGRFEADVNLTGIGAPKGVALAKISTLKHARGNWNVGGAITSMSIGGSLSGDLSARSIGTANVKGDLDDANWTLSQAVDARLKAISSLVVGGKISLTSIRATGNVGGVTTGAIVDSLLFAGVKSAVSAIPSGLDDFENPSAAIASLTVKGQSIAPSFVRSSVAAGTLAKVSLKLVEPENAGIPMGFAAHLIGSFTRSGAATLVKLTIVKSNNDESLGGDFVVRTV